MISDTSDVFLTFGRWVPMSLYESLSYVQTDATISNIVCQQCWELLRPFARGQKFDRFQTLRNNSRQQTRTKASE